MRKENGKNKPKIDVWGKESYKKTNKERRKEVNKEKLNERIEEGEGKRRWQKAK